MTLFIRFASQVFAFVRAVLLRMLPDKLWGTGLSKRALLRAVHSFVRLGRADAVYPDDVCVSTVLLKHIMPDISSVLCFFPE